MYHVTAAHISKSPAQTNQDSIGSFSHDHDEITATTILTALNEA